MSDLMVPPAYSDRGRTAGAAGQTKEHRRREHSSHHSCHALPSMMKGSLPYSLQMSLFHPISWGVMTRQSLEAVMTSVHDLQGLATRTFYFSMTASVFIFVALLLMRSPHP